MQHVFYKKLTHVEEAIDDLQSTLGEDYRPIALRLRTGIIDRIQRSLESFGPDFIDKSILVTNVFRHHHRGKNQTLLFFVPKDCPRIDFGYSPHKER